MACASLIEQKSRPTCSVCSQHNPKILLVDGSHRSLSSTLISSIISTYPHPEFSRGFLKAAQILLCISDLVGNPAEGESDVIVDLAAAPYRNVERVGAPSVWCARLATRAPPNQRKSNPRDISSSVKFLGLYKPFLARSSSSIIPLIPPPRLRPA